MNNNNLSCGNIKRRVQNAIVGWVGDQHSQIKHSERDILNGVLKISKDLASIISNTMTPKCRRCCSYDVYIATELWNEIVPASGIKKRDGMSIMVDTYMFALSMICAKCGNETYIGKDWDSVSDLWLSDKGYDVSSTTPIDNTIDSKYCNRVSTSGDNRVFVGMRLFPSEDDFWEEISSLISKLERLAKGGKNDQLEI